MKATARVCNFGSGMPLLETTNLFVPEAEACQVCSLSEGSPGHRVGTSGMIRGQQGEPATMAGHDGQSQVACMLHLLPHADPAGRVDPHGSRRSIRLCSPREKDHAIAPGLAASR
jgi:hypothetical protein